MRELLAAFVACVVCSATAHAEVIVIASPTPHEWTAARTVSGDGKVVGGSTSSGESFRWTRETGWQSIFSENWFGEGVTVGSPDGSIFWGDETGRPFRWTEAEGVTLLSNPGEPPPMEGAGFSRPTGASADGRIVVGNWWLWQEGVGFFGFGDLRGMGSIDAVGISRDGRVAAGSSARCCGFPNEAWIWTPEDGIRRLGRVPGSVGSTNVRAISGDGRTIVGDFDLPDSGHATPFRWTEQEGFIPLSDPRGTLYRGWGYVTAVSADGRFIVGYGNTYNSSGDGWIWTAESGIRLLRDLLPELGHLNSIGLVAPFWELIWPESVSDDGRVIVGRATPELGFQEAFVLILPALAGACYDGLDNDADGLIDFPADPGCKNWSSSQETPACQDGTDDDADGAIDFDGGAAANHGVAFGPADPDCHNPYQTTEGTLPACGLGAEVPLVLAPLLLLATRRSRRHN